MRDLSPLKQETETERAKYIIRSSFYSLFYLILSRQWTTKVRKTFSCDTDYRHSGCICWEGTVPKSEFARGKCEGRVHDINHLCL